ncbi:DUF6279 family lipoprotein [Microbulbifer rhizosphaerae]|uniref:Lipoprotein n=1 Tax=Microbulbifer rhizosphaerae TaxID=1562603 RepID=A0A7W4W7Y4_9GAMM|nr:DUF6279 family lipoprotein [Microbulbifer rhizosphaerae]MBB3059311.1 hypothetical protein [Microbulbifer rhizosphaerae]
MTLGANQLPDRILRLLPATTLLLLLASCSSVQLAYNHMDRWIRWQLDDYVDLKGTQKQQLAAALDSFHRWHRQTQLPDYANYLEQLADRVQQSQFTSAELQTVEKQVRVFWDTASTQFYDLLLPLAATLDSGQIDELEENLQEKREESLEKWRSPEKIQRRRLKQIRKHSRRWLGKLSGEQEALIAEWVAQAAYNPLLRDQQRQLWQARVIELLRRKPEGYLQQLRDLIVNPQQLWSEEYRRMQDQRHRQIRSLSERILATITPEQRLHLEAALRSHAGDFRSLSHE